MVSAVENMAANTSWSSLGKATDLRNRIFFTLGLLIVYRLGTFIPVPVSYTHLTLPTKA